MAYKAYVVDPIGSSKIDVTASAPTGAETVTATIGVGNIGVILEDTVALNEVEIINALDQLRDYFKEANK